MKILHVVPTYIPAWRYGGTIQSVHGLCKALTLRGHQVEVVTTSVDGASDSQVIHQEIQRVDGVNVRYFQSKSLRRIYWAPTMETFVRHQAKNFDLIHTHSIFLWPTWMAERVARQQGIPYIVSPRGMLVKELVRRKNPLLKNLWIQWVERKNLEQASAIHWTSDIEKEEAAKFSISLPQGFVIPNGAEIRSEDPPQDHFEENLFKGLPAASPLILFLGRIHWKKGLDRLIPALRHIPEAQLVIVGNDEEGYGTFLKKLAAEHHVENRLHFFEPVYGAKKEALYKRATVFALPSYSENFGNTVLEAMSAGCPVLVTREVGLSGTVASCRAGLVSKGDPKALAEALNQIISNPELGRQMGENGMRAARESFGWPAIAGRMENAYQQILEKASQR